MNDLQLGLFAIGGVGVAGVFAYNKWQEYRHRKLAQRMLGGERGDVLLDGAAGNAVSGDDACEGSDIGGIVAGIEPSFVATADAAPPTGRQEPSFSCLEPTFDEVASDVPAAAPLAADEPIAPAPPQRAAEPLPAAGEVDDEGVPAIVVSAAIDHVARFELVDPVAGSEILAAQRELLARVAKPLGWAGYNERSGLWERVAEDGSYRRLRIGLQLADRRGPLGEADLITFEGAMRNLAEGFMAVVELPPHSAALSAAIVLDAFCANVDIQIGLNLVSRGQGFAGTKIRALAEAAGMTLDASGRFVRCDDDGFVLYTLANEEAVAFANETMKSISTRGLGFSLDVPRVAHGDRVFAQMLELARRMADTLDGVLVDDNRRPLTEAMLEPFRRQIGQYQAQLAARGFHAGGPLAQRLFA